jgi:hypothetical protein
MHANQGRRKTVTYDSGFEPRHHVVSRSHIRRAEVVIQADLFDPSGLQKLNCFGSRIYTKPTRRGFALIIKIDAQTLRAHL